MDLSGTLLYQKNEKLCCINPLNNCYNEIVVNATGIVKLIGSSK